MQQLVRFARFTSIDASACFHLLGDDLLAHLQGMPLTRLDLPDCDNLMNDGVGHLRELPASSTPELKVLYTDHGCWSGPFARAASSIS